MEEMGITLKREDLYEKVWQKPMSRLAPEYRLSDVGLKKICKKLKVPTPPRGYWVKLRHGYKIPVTPLPKLKFADPDTYYLQEPSSNKTNTIPDIDENDFIPQKIKIAKHITVPKQLRDPHPLIKDMINALEKEKPDDYGAVHAWRKPHFTIRLNPKNLNRALRILDTLVKWFEDNGFRFKNDRGQRPDVYIEIFGEKVKFGIKEKMKRVDHVPTKKEIEEERKYPWMGVQQYDYIPIGKLTLIIDEWGAYGIKKKWSDAKSKQIEEMLNDFLIGIFKVAHRKRQRRLEREEEERKWIEEQERLIEETRRREIEEEQLRDLENQAQLWLKSKQIRAYIQAVEHHEKELFSEDSRQKLDRWLLWARQHADRIDPLKNKPYLDDIIENSLM